MVHVDPSLLEQVFVNILENAAKYTPPNSPIEIRAAEEDSRVRIEIADRGPGLSNHSSRVFDKFFRGDTHGIPGVGLGLAISRGIIEAHGGSIEAQNREGGGALFTLTLPPAKAPPPTAQLEIPAPESS
jgi:two-component system sensor histidine kinase KdpD